MEYYVHGFGSFGLDDVRDDAQCSGVVDLDGRWWLWMSHLLEQVPEGQRNQVLAEYAGRLLAKGHSELETLELVRAYYRISDPSVRKRVFDLIKAMTPVE